MKTLRMAAMLALLASTTSACSGDPEDDASAQALEIIGEYDDNFGGEQIISADDWNGSKIAGYDNAKNSVYTQFPDDDQFNPSKFAKTVYTDPQAGSFYFCMVEFSLATLDEAKQSTTGADDSDPETSGCGGEFAWTKATKK